MTQSNRKRQLVLWLLALSASALFAVHVAAAFTESINWDEFALLARVKNMLLTGQLQGGGRPALAELLLAPFVAGCRDACTTIQHARLLWSLFVLAAGVAFFLLALRARADRTDPLAGALLAVVLFVAALPFLRWSIQVRTDQPSMALGLWGGVALLASRERRWLAVAAGLCFGLAYGFTQKLAYVASLCLLLASAEIWVRASGPWRRELSALGVRLLLCAAGSGIVLVLYRGFLPLFVAIPKPQPIAGALAVFANYRHTFGLALQRGMLAALAPHLVLLGVLVLATIRCLVCREPLRHLAVSWAILALGLCIACVHTGLFPYFWLTLGLFPACALGYAFEELAVLIPRSLRTLAAVATGTALLLPAALYSSLLLNDSQGVQRAALQFVERNFPDGQDGFQIEGALFCRNDATPTPILFREAIESRYFGPAARRNIDALLERFRSKPVRFMIESHMLPFFPAEVRQFWLENYQPYYGPVRIAGRRLAGEPGKPAARFSLLFAGRYRWLAFDPKPSAALRVDETALSNEQLIELAQGEHRVEFMARSEGFLVLAVKDRPWFSGKPFYDFAPIRELIGRDYWQH